MIKFVGIKELNGSFLLLDVEGAKPKDSVGDQVWISADGTEMELYLEMDSDIFERTADLFQGDSKRGFKGAMRRFGYGCEE
jgi:hypothetical protein